MIVPAGKMVTINTVLTLEGTGGGIQDAAAITVWRYEDAPADLQALADGSTPSTRSGTISPTGKAGWLALVPRTYADKHDLWWLEHIDSLHGPAKHAHPSLSEYQVWIGAHG